LLRIPASGANERIRAHSSRNAEPAHPAQHRLAGVLERQVEVRRHAVGARDHLDQPRPGLSRLQVADPDPLDALDRGQPGQQRLQ
jgi:hypothetical protein